MTYGVAIVSVAVALALSELLEPFLGDARPYLAILGAVVISVWHGGWRPAAFAAVIGYLGTVYLFIMPRHAEGVPRIDFAEELAAYLVSCGILILLGELWRRARRRAEQHLKRLEQEIAERKEAELRLTANLASRKSWPSRHSSRMLSPGCCKKWGTLSGGKWERPGCRIPTRMCCVV
jgi:K+-sensing histidine kinase KdpD